MASCDGVEFLPTWCQRNGSWFHWICSHRGLLWSVSNHCCPHGQGEEAPQVYSSLPLRGVDHLLRLAVATLYPGGFKKMNFLDVEI